MQLDLTREQFLMLMKLVFLGEFVINWHALPQEWQEEPMKLKDFIVQKAVDTKILDYLEYYTWSKEYDYSHEKNEEFYDLIDQYCSQNFHEDLVEIISHNILRKKYGGWTINVMSAEKYDHLFSQMIDTVINDITKNEYENIVLSTE